ncbi:MAG: stalk domain-containing protein [Armatimonadota bacterium]|nr:stalk domain-containing protein [Armatimonadota bacterium]
MRKSIRSSRNTLSWGTSGTLALAAALTPGTMLGAQPAWADVASTGGNVPIVSGNDVNGPLVTIVKPHYSDQLRGKEQVLVAIKARNFAPKTIEMFVDDKSATGGPMDINTLTLPSPAFNWDTTAFQDGPHRLTVRVTDTQGFRGQSDVVVYVNNNKEVATTPPVLKWLNLSPGEVLHGDVKIQLQAVNKFGVKYIYVSLNPANAPAQKPPLRWWLINRPPYEVALNTRRISDGNYVLNATGFDAFEQEGYASLLPITIANLLPTPFSPTPPRDVNPGVPAAPSAPTLPTVPVAKMPQGATPPPTAQAIEPLPPDQTETTSVNPELLNNQGSSSVQDPPQASDITPGPEPDAVPEATQTQTPNVGTAVPTTPQVSQLAKTDIRPPVAPPATTALPLDVQGAITPPSRLAAPPQRAERIARFEAMMPSAGNKRSPAASSTLSGSSPAPTAGQKQEWSGSIVYKPLPRLDAPAGRTARAEGGRATAPSGAARPTNEVVVAAAPAMSKEVALTRMALEAAAVLAVRSGAPSVTRPARAEGNGRLIAPSGAARNAMPKTPTQPTLLERMVAAPPVKSPATYAPGGVVSIPPMSIMEATRIIATPPKPNQTATETQPRRAALPKFPSPLLRSSEPASITVAPIANWSMQATNLPTIHTSERDETVKAIAARYRVPAPVLAAANNLQPWSHVRTGTALQLPKALLVKYGGKPVTGDVASFMMGSTGVTPFRFLFQAQGGTLTWDQKNWRVTARNGDREVTLAIGSKSAIVNREEVMMDLAAFLCSGRTMVPLRFFEKALHAQVEWEPTTGRLYVAAAN